MTRRQTTRRDAAIDNFSAARVSKWLLRKTQKKKETEGFVELFSLAENF